MNSALPVSKAARLTAGRGCRKEGHVVQQSLEQIHAEALLTGVPLPIAATNHTLAQCWEGMFKILGRNRPPDRTRANQNAGSNTTTS